MRIFLLGASVSWNTLTVESSDTIADLKAKIQKEEGIPQDLQKLMHGGQLLEVDQGRTLADYNISNDTEVHLSPRIPGSLRISVETPTGESINFKVPSSGSMDDVKAEIRDDVGRKVAVYSLKKGSNLQSVMDVGAGKSVGLKITGTNHRVGNEEAGKSGTSMQIILRSYCGKCRTVDVHSGDTFGSLKTKIFLMDGVLPSQIVLCYNGKGHGKEDSQDTLEACGITNGIVLNLIVRLKG